MLDLSLEQLARIIPAVLVGLTVHELAHAWVAVSLGDETPRLMGRLTLNPIKHIDPIGALLLLVAGFGWAKPVIINRENLKHPVRDDLMISLAGPFSNFVLAFFLALAFRVVLLAVSFPTRDALEAVYLTFVVFIWINVGLGIFNLLPIPPLDGSHLFSSLLDLRSPRAGAAYRRYGSLALLGIILLDRASGADLLPIGGAIEAVGRAFLRLSGVG
jgi:Zn-dependent protease